MIGKVRIDGTTYILGSKCSDGIILVHSPFNLGNTNLAVDEPLVDTVKIESK